MKTGRVITTNNFGAELRRRRYEAGLSLNQLAERVHYHKGYLSKIENGQKPPSEELARQCDAELHAGGELLALAGQSGPAVPEPSGISDAADLWALHHAPDQLLLVPGASGTGWAPPTDLVSEVGSGVALSESGLASFARILAEYRQLGQQTSPAALLPGLIVQTKVLLNLARQTAEPMQVRLHGLAGQYAEYTGWLAQEAGDDRAAIWWTDVAVELARRAGQRDMEPHALVRKALISMYREDGRRTIDLAAQAQRDAAASPRIRGLAAQREAQGHALLGDHDNCHRALDLAAVLLATAAQGQDPNSVALALGPSRITDLDQMARGWCLLDLGRPEQSADILDRVVAAIPETAHRSRARYGARRALAYAMAQEIDHACDLTGDVLDSAELIDSATIRIELRSLRRSLSRWSTHQPVRQIMPRLADALA
jgi:transcriptional regulator with XRE-family HTH domain/tetratricopeptide (TPR) repeat protein